MSTKTTFKRIALVTVAALGFGLLSSVAPASAGVAQSLTVAVGPNGATSLTVVGGDSGTASALVRVDVTSNDSASGQAGLTGSEIVTGTVTAVPTGVTAKTLAANGGSMADTITVPGAGKSDFSMINSGAGSAQTSGTPAGTAATSSSGVTNWGNKFKTGVNTFNDSGTPASAQGTADLGVATGVIKAGHTGYVNMDSNKATTVTGTFTKSYYVTIIPRANAVVMDQGAYTFQFQLTDAAGVVRSTKTVKIDFVTTAAKSDASIALATSGTFLTGTAVAAYDTDTTNNYATLTLTNRDGGLVRKFDGDVVVPSATLQKVYTGLITSDSFSFTVDDSGTYGADFGTKTAVAGNGTLKAYDGVYGLTATANQIGAQATATGYAFQIWAGYGNATIKTLALTLYAPDGSGSASSAKTDVQLTAKGIKATDAVKFTNIGATKAYTLPTTATSASLKFWIADATDTATGGALITATPTWSAYGSNAVTPATSTTGTVYTTDALGNFTVSVTNTTPVDGASLSLVLSGGLAFGAGTNTVTLTWKDPVATTIAVADPVTGVYVKTGSTNVTTVIVTDQFGNPVANQGVSVAIPGTTDANYSATATISPIKTGADGTATYSLVGGATTATSDTISFNCIPTACAAAATIKYNYVTTLPVVASMAAYHGLTWGTADILTPSTGIYSSGTTKLLINTARDLSVSGLTDAGTTSDEIALRFTALTSAGVSATGAVVTVTAGEGGHIVSPATGLPVKSYNYVVGSTGTGAIKVLATGTGAITFTATSGTVTATASMWVANATTDARFVKITSAATGTANGSGVPVTVTVTDRYGNVVSGVAVNVVASGVGSFMGGSITNSFTTDASGTYTFLANTVVSEGGVAKFTATSGTTADFTSSAGFVGATAVDSTLAAGNSSASASITFAAGASATDVAQTATDAAAEATDAANAATDAANAAAEAADAATAAAQDAADAVAALSTQVSEMVNALKKQITALTNLVIKIQKKVKA